MTPSDKLLDAALAVVGEAGLSGLTWEQIDERAGIAAGTTASLFPTIDVLVEAMLGRLITLDGEAWLSTGTALNPTSAREFADRMAALTVSHVEIIGRATRARLALFLGRPEAMSQGQAALFGRHYGHPGHHRRPRPRHPEPACRRPRRWHSAARADGPSRRAHRPGRSGRGLLAAPALKSARPRITHRRRSRVRVRQGRTARHPR